MSLSPPSQPDADIAGEPPEVSADGGPLEPSARRVALPNGLSALAAGPLGGEGPPVLLLHGMMGGAWQFAWAQRALAEAGLESLALDYRGHNASAPVASLGRLCVEDYLADALIACASLGRSPIVVGQSMGGLIAQMLAARGAVRAAVLACSLPPAGIRWRGATDPRRAWRHAAATLTGRPLRPLRDELDFLIFNCIPPEQRQAFFDRQVPESSRAGIQIAFGRVHVDAAAVDCPVLSLGAEHDNLVAPQIAAALAQRYRGEHLEIAGAGHYALVGEPGWEQTAARIIAWIDRLG